jgi:hypothetical protein
MNSAGKLENPERLITARISIENAMKDGFTKLIDNPERDVKILVSPDVAWACHLS